MRKVNPTAEIVCTENSVLEPATLAGVVEDHAYEQFFFDASTRASLLTLLAEYDRPLLVCTPSLAVAAEEAGVAELTAMGFSEAAARDALASGVSEELAAQIDLLQVGLALEMSLHHIPLAESASTGSAASAPRPFAEPTLTAVRKRSRRRSI